MTNKYAGKCGACGADVAPSAGILEYAPAYRRRRRYILWCRACYDKSDKSGAEDRACGNRAYEDECARRCGL